MAQQTIDEPRTTEQRFQMSYEEFLAWADDIHAEWVNGEVIVFMPPKDKHQELVGFLHTLVSLFADLFHLGVVRVAPLEMRLAELNASREPDILFVANAHRARLTPDRLDGPADLVVEIVSPSSLHRDRTTKFFEYQQAGVHEYWIIDPRPEARRIDGYVLNAAGQYQAIAPDEAGRYHSQVLPGCWLRPDWLWQEPLPNPLLVLAEIRDISPDIVQAFRRTLGGEA